MSRDVVLVPSTLALLPEYAGAHDPVADLRSACAEAARTRSASTRPCWKCDQPS